MNIDDEITNLMKTQRTDYEWWPSFIHKYQIDPKNPSHSKYYHIIKNGFRLSTIYAPAIFAFCRTHGTFVASAVYLTPYIIKELPENTPNDEIHAYVRERLQEILGNRPLEIRGIEASEINNSIEWLRREAAAREKIKKEKSNGF